MSCGNAVIKTCGRTDGGWVADGGGGGGSDGRGAIGIAEEGGGTGGFGTGPDAGAGTSASSVDRNRFIGSNLVVRAPRKRAFDEKVWGWYPPTRSPFFSELLPLTQA